MADSFASMAAPLLNKQVEVAAGLLEKLQLEYGLLKKEEEGDLEALSKEKLVFVNELEVLSQQWLASLQALRITITLDGIHDALQSHDPDGQHQLVSSWEKLGELASECQRQNTVNGAIVAVQEQTTQAALDILRGKVPGEDSTYSSKGRSSGYSNPSGAGGSLGKA
jgi:flagella synthesis protein FlgN